MKVLIVEDDCALRDLLTDLVVLRGHEVDAYADAESAWHAHQSDPSPLILIDWILPGLDGLDLCRQIRAGDNGERSVVVILSARADPDAADEAMAAGADDFVAKPFDLAVLETHLARAESLAAGAASDRHLGTPGSNGKTSAARPTAGRAD